MSRDTLEKIKIFFRHLFVILLSFILSFLSLKDEVLFIAMVILIMVLFCINWSFFSILLLVMLAIVQPGLFNETLEMFRPFFLISGASFLSWVMGFSSRRLKQLARTPQILFVLGLLITETVSSLRVGWMAYTVETFLLWFKIFLIFFLVANLVDSISRVKFILWATILSTTYVAIYALDIYFFFPEKMVMDRLAAYGMYENPNDLALLMVVAWPLIFKLHEIENFMFSKLLLGAILFIHTLTLLFTVSRGGLMGLVVVGGFCVATSTKIKKRGKIILLGGGLSVALVAMPLVLSQRGEESGFDAEDESASARIDAWKAGGRILLKNPIGVGYNQFIENVGDYGGPNYLQAHNTPIKVAAESGYIGLGCYLAMLFLSFKQLLMLEIFFQKQQVQSILAIVQALRIALMGFLINTSFSVKEIEWVLYIIVGLTTAIVELARSMAGKKSNQPEYLFAE